MKIFSDNRLFKGHISDHSKSLVRGFTLIETVITIAVIGLMMGLAVPMVSSFSKAELRMTTGRLSSLIQNAFDEAALSGGTSRLVFDLDQGSVTLETQEEVQYLSKAGKSIEEERAKSIKEEDDEEPKNNDDDQLAIGGETITKGELASLAAAMGLGPRKTQAARINYSQAGDESTTYKLPEGIKFEGFWAEHLSEELHKGQVYLYFFSMGYTEEAIIYITNEEGIIYSLEVQPLTGRVVIHDERIEIP